MLATRFCVGGSVHIWQERNIFDTQAVNDYVTMNVPAVIVTVGVGADDSLMSCEVLMAKLLAQLLHAVNCQAVLNTISRVKTDYVVVDFNIAPIAVFAILKI